VAQPPPPSLLVILPSRWPIMRVNGGVGRVPADPGSAANANCALRTLRRMLHKAEEWKVIGHSPKIKMMKDARKP